MSGRGNGAGYLFKVPPYPGPGNGGAGGHGHTPQNEIMYSAQMIFAVTGKVNSGGAKLSQIVSRHGSPCRAASGAVSARRYKWGVAMRRSMVVIAVALPLVAGCRMLGLDRDGFDLFAQREVKTPTVAPASVEAAARVDRIGRQLVAGSPFLGLDPTFQTVGPTQESPTSEPELFHFDTTGVFLTEGLVTLCKTDEQLAGVLAHELGLMAAESRRADRMRLPQPIPAAAMGGKPDGSTDFDPARAMYLADFEKNVRKPSERKMYPTTDARQIARQLLKDAGFAETCLDDAGPILKRANRTQKVAKQLGGSAASPKWTE